MIASGRCAGHNEQHAVLLPLLPRLPTHIDQSNPAINFIGVSKHPSKYSQCISNANLIIRMSGKININLTLALEENTAAQVMEVFWLKSVRATPLFSSQCVT